MIADQIAEMMVGNSFEKDGGLSRPSDSLGRLKSLLTSDPPQFIWPEAGPRIAGFFPEDLGSEPLNHARRDRWLAELSEVQRAASNQRDAEVLRGEDLWRAMQDVLEGNFYNTTGTTGG